MAHIQQRNNTFYFRIRIPETLQPYFNQREIKKSLGIMSKYEASLVSERLSLKSQDTFNQLHTLIRSQKLSEALSDPNISSRSYDIATNNDPQMIAKDLTDHIQNLLSPEPVRVIKSLCLEDMINEYCIEKMREKSWTLKSEQENRAIYTLFVRIVGNIPLDKITHITARQYKTILQQLPPNLNKAPKYRDKTIEQVVALKPITLMSINTLNKNLIRISSLFKWADLHGYVTKNYFIGLTLRNNKRADEERSIFTEEDLKKIFKYPSNLKHNYNYWLPILGLYTGCRLEELCQLYLDDVRKEDDIWILDINDNNDKKLKTKSSKRFVPLHPKIIELGFIKFIQTLQENKELRVFPELKKRRDGYSMSASKWFSIYKRKLDIDDSKVFHSFRHTFTNTLKQSNTEESIASALLGHSTDNITYSRYGKSYNVKKLLEIIMKINFDHIQIK